jgi:hypothetical protein
MEAPVVLLPSLIPFLQPFCEQMTRPTFTSFCTLVSGWSFAARHNVAGSLRAVCHAGRAATAKHFCAYHRVFAAARWGLDAVGLALLAMILSLACVGGATVFLVIDDTLCPKCGRRMFGVDSHYDAANTGRKRSNAKQSLKRRGHCWVILGVVVPLPFAKGRHACLPVLFRLYMNKKGARRNAKAYRSRPELARQLLAMVCAQHPQRHFHVLVDSAYGGQDTLRQLPANCDLTARWQLNVRLCQPPPKRQPGQRGRPRQRGPALPSPRGLLDGRCDHLDVELNGKTRGLRVASLIGCLHTVPQRTLRMVAVEPLTSSGKPRPKYRAFYYSTTTDTDAPGVLQGYALRWTIEVAIHDSKQQGGLGQAQGWSEPAVLRTAPTLMLLYSVVVLWFTHEGHRVYRKPIWPWYRHKTAISFADMLATLRLQTLRHHLKQNLSTPLNPQSRRNPLRLLLRFARLAA